MASKPGSGLEALVNLDKVFIQQKFIWFSSSSNFVVFDPAGNLIYNISGESEWFIRDKTMHVLDLLGNGINCERDYSNRTMTVTSSTDGRLLGTVTRDDDCTVLNYTVLDPGGAAVFTIAGTEGCWSNTYFDILPPDGNGTRIASITKVLTGGLCMVQEQYELAFPVDLAVEMKAVLMATAIMIDIAFSRRRRNRMQRRFN